MNQMTPQLWMGPTPWDYMDCCFSCMVTCLELLVQGQPQATNSAKYLISWWSKEGNEAQKKWRHYRKQGKLRYHFPRSSPCIRIIHRSSKRHILKGKVDVRGSASQSSGGC